MYWNLEVLIDPKGKMLLNSNIRCIEMREKRCFCSYGYSWIVTLDVLKSFYVILFVFAWFCWIVTLDVLKCDIDIQSFTGGKVE